MIALFNDDVVVIDKVIWWRHKSNNHIFLQLIQHSFRLLKSLQVGEMHWLQLILGVIIWQLQGNSYFCVNKNYLSCY